MPKFLEREGDELPCCYCLSTNGVCQPKCSLNNKQTKRYNPLPCCGYDMFIQYSSLTLAKKTKDSVNPCTNRIIRCQDCSEVYWTIFGNKHYAEKHEGVSCPDICRINEEIIDEMKDSKYLTSYKYVVKENKAVVKSLSVTVQRRKTVEANLSNPRKKKKKKNQN